jgi:hypothetical protein
VDHHRGRFDGARLGLWGAGAAIDLTGIWLAHPYCIAGLSPSESSSRTSI